MHGLFLKVYKISTTEVNYQISLISLLLPQQATNHGGQSSAAPSRRRTPWGGRTGSPGLPIKGGKLSRSPTSMSSAPAGGAGVGVDVASGTRASKRTVKTQVGSSHPVKRGGGNLLSVAWNLGHLNWGRCRGRGWEGVLGFGRGF